MSELKFTGNCLKGSLPLLSFDGGFEESPHNQLERTPVSGWFLLAQTKKLKVFGTPRMHPRSKPFIDHVLTFSLVDGRIWVRNYQIVEEEGNKSALEIGPRFVMNPIKILSGGFSDLFMGKSFLDISECRACCSKAQERARLCSKNARH